MSKKIDLVAPPLSTSHCSLRSIYERVLSNTSLFLKEYQLLTVILIYVQLRIKIRVTQRVDFFDSSHKDVLLTRALLDKTLYFMDAIASKDINGNITVFLPMIYREQLLKLLSSLLQSIEPNIKPAYESGIFYETTYGSICDKLNLDKDTLLLFYLQNVHKKSKSVYVRGLSVVDYDQSLEVQLYSKYDNFNRDECTNYRFVVTKSSVSEYPVGSYIFGVIQPNKCDVILYKNRECTIRI
jgi:hypothetical protein